MAADNDQADNAHETRTSTASRTADAIAQPDDQTPTSVREVVPLFDIINTCLEELPVLRAAMSSGCATACLVSDGGLEIHSSSPDQLTSLLSELDNLDHKEHAALIIEDIDAVWFHALATRFPASLDVRFLAQHVLCMGDLKATYDPHGSLRDEYETLVCRVDAEISQRLSGTTVDRDHQCQHIDGWFRRYGINVGLVQLTAPEVDGYRLEGFCSVGDSQRVCKNSTRISYCRLRENLTLVLVDAGSDSVGTLQVIDYLQLLPADASGYVVPLNFMRDLFRHYTINSIFTQPAVNYIKHLLSTSAYQAVVPKLERDLLEWRQRAAQAGIEEAFSFLTELRLDLINTHQTMAETGGSVVHDVLRSEAHANQGQRSPAQNVQTTTEATMIGPEDAASTSFHATGLRKPKPADLSKLSETFTDLDARLRAIITALNDDIQIVIGSVQIQDAKAMKRQADLTMQLTETTIRQTEVSVRQTRWTVALAVLAALYLPMTLVTGIYGMNIREITGGEGPNWWWVVVTWAVTMGITVGSVGRYALVEWRWYRQGMQGPKVEGNQDSTEGIPGEQNHGTTKPAIGKADDIGSLSITRRKRLWRKISGNSQYNGTRSTV